jgi:hypothetical protein
MSLEALYSIFPCLFLATGRVMPPPAVLPDLKGGFSNPPKQGLPFLKKAPRIKSVHDPHGMAGEW